jgi:hypothetical protein
VEGIEVLCWGDWGTLITYIFVYEPVWSVIATDGVEAFAEPFTSVLAEGPDGATIWQGREFGPPQPAPYILSPDRQQHWDVPGLSSGESLSAASWSPHGDLLALSLEPGTSYSLDKPHSMVRIVDTATGSIITEWAVDNLYLFATAWSSDGRFFVHQVLAGDEPSATLGFYDTVSDTKVMVPLTEIIDEIRTQSDR